MKKLMVMLGAVAMSFGLFAADSFSISFEAAEGASGTGKGVDVSAMKFTPGTGWTWTGGALDMVKYNGDAYTYTTTRRTFDDQDNLNYLTLSTGSDELVREMGAGNIFVDQLVKFTGFEDAPTELGDGTKIAVWMSGIENDTGVTGETNLYVTVGQVDADGKLVKQVALAIENPNGADWETEKWYRLTIKSINNIFGNESQLDARAGFIVYIDGVQVASSDDAAKTIVAATGDLSTAAAGYMAKGQLFPAIDNEDAVFTSVAYKGIGAIDDVMLDDQGPDFCQFVNVTVTEIPGAVITVKQGDEEITKGEDGKYAVAPGAFTVTYTADDGYILTPVVKPHNTADLVENTVNDSDDVKPQLLIATVSWNDGANTFEAASLSGALEKIQELEGLGVDPIFATIAQDAEETVAGGVIGFDANTMLGVYVNDGAWSIMGNAKLAADIEAGKTVSVISNGDEEAPFGGDLEYSGEVAGTLNAVKLTKIEEDAITIAEDGAVTVGTQITDYATFFTAPTGFKVVETENTEDGTWTYTVEELPPAIEYVKFTVTYNADEVENVTVTTNNGVAVDIIGGQYTVESNALVTVAAEAKEGYKNVQITSTDVTVEGGVFTASKAEQAITITADAKAYYTSIELTPATLELKVGETGNLTAITTPTTTDDDELEWTSSAEGVATVTTEGVVTAVASGEATITVASKHDSTVKGTCTVTVTAAAAPDPTDDDPTKIPEGQTAADRYGDKVIPTELANVSASSVCAWAQGAGKHTVGEPIIENAFLLNCENDQDKVEEAEAAFKIPSITVASDGTVTVAMPEGDFNGEIKKLGKVELSDADWVENKEGAKFFQLKLVPINVPPAAD